MRYTWSRMETVMIATSENIQKQEEMKSIYVFSNGLLRNNVIKWNLKKKTETWVLGRQENKNYKLSLYILLKLKKDLNRNIQ